MPQARLQLVAATLEATPAEAKQALEKKEAVLIDVREPEEFALAQVEGAILMPMNTVPSELQRLEALADEGSLLILCHHGVRSLQVAYWLQQQGIEQCASVAGGIDRWSLEVDPTIPRY